MKRLQLTLFFSFLVIKFLSAQTGCPGCMASVPAGLPADTVFLPALPAGQQGTYYDVDLPFRLPLTSTPVAAIDSTTPPGLPISKFEVLGIDNLPAGLSWQPNQFVFETATQTDGCFRICGTPLESDSFVLTVRLKATVFFFAQETSFPMRLYIAPQTVSNNGFTMSNFEGCGETTVSFTNNNPSSGQAGFTYAWDFGDGSTYTGENPAPHLYNTPGIFPVHYHASIDTVGYILQSVTVLSVDCTDPLNAPDLYVRLYDPNNTEIFNSSPAINNTPLPLNVPLNIPLDNGNYRVNVTDEDSGIKGTDDPCGNISFNYLSNDTLVAGGFTVVLHIIHPILEVDATDTVTVFYQPATPQVMAPQGFGKCTGDGAVVLLSSFGAGNQWWLNGEPIEDANDFIYQTAVSGYYQVQILTSDGCSSISDSALVEYYPIPDAPAVTAPNGFAGCLGAAPVQLVSSYTNGNQWLLNGEAIPGAENNVYQANTAGYYQVQYSSAEACTSVSDSVHVTFLPAPTLPVFDNNNNLLSVVDTSLLPSFYTLQWNEGANPIPGANGFSYCATESGNYSLLVHDPTTGCSSQYALQVVFDPTFDCTSMAGEVWDKVGFRIFPNPANTAVNIDFIEPLNITEGQLQLRDAQGRLILQQSVGLGAQHIQMPLGKLSPGVYVLELNSADLHWRAKLVIAR